MKMFRSLLSILAFVAVFSANAFAQESADVNVEATVITALTVATSTHISLGTIQAGTPSTIAAGSSDEVSSQENLGVSATFGTVTIDGANSTPVIVTYTDAVLTEESSTSTEVTFTTTAYSPEKDGGAGLFTSGSQINLNGTGDATIYLGGTLAAATAGSYSTDNGGNHSPITVTVQYQ